MHHPTDRIAHTTAFVAPVMEHWLEREIAQWVHPMKDRSDDPSHHERTLLPRSCISLRFSVQRYMIIRCQCPRTWPTCASMLQHCCRRETGGWPRLVASWTRRSCSFWVVLSMTACSMATAANQLERESALNSPPHSSWPAVIVFTVWQKS